MKLLVASDFHGNEKHMEAAIALSHEVKPDVFIYLGDFSPNRFTNPTPDLADQHSRQVFFPFIRRLNATYRFVMAGNTDFRINCEIYEKEFTDSMDFKFITQGIASVNNVQFFFCSYTHLSPHSLKDFEAFDDGSTTLSKSIRMCKSPSGTAFEIQDNVQTCGEVSICGGPEGEFLAADKIFYSTKWFKQVDFTDPDSEICAQTAESLKERFSMENTKNAQIWCSHGPPHGFGDRIRSGKRVGSKALQSRINEQKPKLVLSGHVHEGCEVDQYSERWGQTMLGAVGNEGVVVPQCLKAYFLVVDYSEKNDSVTKIERIETDVEEYDECQEALRRWKAVADRLRHTE